MVPLFLLIDRIRDFQHMIRHDTSNDRIAKIIVNWCKENGLQNSEKRNGCFAFAACRFASAERSVDAICLSLDCACSCH